MKAAHFAKRRFSEIRHLSQILAEKWAFAGILSKSSLGNVRQIRGQNSTGK
jgi:hypothetical protein